MEKRNKASHVKGFYTVQYVTNHKHQETWRQGTEQLVAMEFSYCGHNDEDILGVYDHSRWA